MSDAPSNPLADLHEVRARRYADALTAAAAADEQVKALTEALAKAEFDRSVAETALAAVQGSPSFGKVFVGDAAPPPEAMILLDLVSGQVWVRPEQHANDTRDVWVRGEKAHGFSQMQYQWPLEEGPFIAIDDDWAFFRMIADASKQDTAFEDCHAMLKNRPGYRDGDSSHWLKPVLSEALARVLAAADTAKSELLGERRDLKQQVRDLERDRDLWKQMYHDIKARHEGDDQG